MVIISPLRPYVTDGEVRAAAALDGAGGVGAGVVLAVTGSWWWTGAWIAVAWVAAGLFAVWLFNQAQLRRNR